MKHDILKDLNKDQQEAVLNTDGPMIILAGAGSGKTRVLTYKVIYLIKEKSIDPLNILMVTFTNKAANEMKERVQKLLGRRPTIAKAKNELITESDYSKYARGHFQEIVVKVYLVYQKILKEYEALDFDDLLIKTVALFEQNPHVLQKYQDRFRYILVDEYQDTNHAQYLLTKMLADKHKNICVVGDFAQSIYSWRGADFTNLTKFKSDFRNTKTFSLSQNYRSTQKILDAASSVISRN